MKKLLYYFSNEKLYTLVDEIWKWIVTYKKFVTILVVLMLIKVVVVLIRKLYSLLLNKVANNSKIIQSLRILNKKYKFEKVEKKISHTNRVKNKKSYNHYNFDAAIVELVRKNLSYYEDLVNKTNYNSKNNSEYLKVLKKIPSFTTKEEFKETDKIKIPYVLFHYCEKKLYNKEIQHPTMEFNLNYKVKYISPGGSRHYIKSTTFYYSHIKQVVAVIKQGISEASYQRSLMTPSMRYDVLKRDKFTCCICGRSRYTGAVLHVDHIVPVSKGGLTVPENLRTLCELCNIGKSNKYDPVGLN